LFDCVDLPHLSRFRLKIKSETVKIKGIVNVPEQSA
jgi:hypothetical protein